MQINVAQLLKASIGSAKTYDVDEIINIEGCDYPIRGTVSLMRTDHGILVQGKLSTDSELTCSRCLTPFGCALDVKIEEVFLPTTDIISGTPPAGAGRPGRFHDRRAEYSGFDRSYPAVCSTGYPDEASLQGRLCRALPDMRSES